MTLAEIPPLVARRLVAAGFGALPAVTALAATDVFTAADHGVIDGQELRYVSGTGFGGLTPGTTYFARDVDPAAGTFKLAATAGGSAVDVTSNGSAGVFRAPLLEDPWGDPDRVRAAIAARLRAAGVCLEVGLPQVITAENTGSGGTFSRLAVVLFIAESPTVAHTPARLALVDAIIEAVRDRRSAVADLQLIDAETFGTEQGYVLHVLTLATSARHGLPA